MWKIEFDRLSAVQQALKLERARVQKGLIDRSYHTFKKRDSELYIVYLPDLPPGPFSIKSPCLWPQHHKETLVSVLSVAAAIPHAVQVYVRILLSAKTAQGHHIFPAGRIDLCLARRLATILPETHPARTLVLKNPAPLLFFEDFDD